MAVLDIVIQIIIGLVIVVVIQLIALKVMKTDQLVVDKKSGSQSAQITMIMNGFVDTSAFVNKSMNTVDLSAPNYVAIPRSVNRKGGAQFTYQFWMYMDQPNAAAYRDKILFIKGDPNPYEVKKVELTAGKGEKHLETVTGKPVISCPMIKFGESEKQMHVMFNTLENLFEKVIIETHPNESHAMRRNLPSLAPNKWVMYTLVFEDHVPINDFEDGISIKFFFNDVLYQVFRVRGALRQNNGNFVVCPNGGMTGCRMGNLAYYNYALDFDAVKSVFLNGPPKSYYTGAFSKTASMQPLDLSSYNVVDLYNL